MLIEVLYKNQRTATDLDICDKGEEDIVFENPVDLLASPAFIAGAGMNQAAPAKRTEACVEKKIALLKEVVSVNFESARSTIGMDETLPVKTLIEQYLISNPDMVITDIEVIASSCRIPFNKKKPGDRSNDEKNLKLAQQRSEFAEKALNELKASRSSLGKVNISIGFGLGGPPYEPLDANSRFKAKGLTEGYEDMVKKLYTEYGKFYQEEAFISPEKAQEKLLTHGSIYEAKFKPFHGFRVEISGYNKKESKCSEPAAKTKGSAGTKSKSE